MRFGLYVFRWIGYMILCALFGVLFSMFRSYFLILFLIILIILPLISIATFLYAYKKVDIEVKSHISILAEGEESEVLIISKNNSFIPLPGLEAEIIFGNSFFGNEDPVDVSVPLKKGGDRLIIPFKITDIGSYYVRINRIKISDWAGLIYVRKKMEPEVDRSKSTVMKSLPKKTYRQKEDISGLETGAVEAEEANRKGSDTSEVTEIREYIEGDRIRDIHWKLSAKTDELMVKVRSSMSGTDIVVVITLRKDIYMTGHIIRYSYGLLNKMLELESGLKLLVYDASKVGFDEYTISDEVSLMQAFADIYDKPLQCYVGDGVAEDDIRSYMGKIYPYLESYVRVKFEGAGPSAIVVN
ncbi:MAG: DUF58 domain-containing protein [Eubacterium sp.]|nr:DUF58 domain-containing protein [Eubacterium sp.]